MILTTKKPITLAVGLLLTALSYANPSHSPINHDSTINQHSPSNALPPLDSINQLGKIDFQLPKMQRFNTDTNVPVIFTPLHNLPVVQIDVSFRAGSAYDTKFGESHMVAKMLTQGTDTLDEEEFIATKEKLAIVLDADSDKDFLSFGLKSLTGTLSPALSLFKNALTTSSFDSNTLERNKTQLLTRLKSRQEDPSYEANKQFLTTLLKNHPYGHLTTGDSDSIKTITSEDLRAFAQRYLVQENAKITITGDISDKDAKRIANDLANSLPTGKKAQALPKITPHPINNNALNAKNLTATNVLPNQPPTTDNRAVKANPHSDNSPAYLHIPMSNTQTHIIMGQLLPAQQKDKATWQAYTDFSVANSILAGGDFNARLMDAIRVKKGYTYGIYGHRSPLATTDIYNIEFSVKGDRTSNAIADTLAVINQTKQQGIKPEELALEKVSRINSFPSGFASNSGIHHIALSLNNDDMPIEYLSDYPNRVNNVSLESANKALQALNPNQWLFVSVGDEKPIINP